MLAQLTSKKPFTGFSLVELMVALAVLGIILSVAAPSFADLLNRRRVAMAAAELSTDLAFARAESGLRSTAVIVYFNQPVQANNGISCYTIAYFGQNGDCDCTKPLGTACDGAIKELKSTQLRNSVGVSLQASGSWDPFEPNRVSFQAPQMMPTLNDLSVTVLGARDAKLTVQVNPMGRVSTCTPNGSMPGFKPC